jgi:DNA-binding PadR family transcriptional regulator
MYPGHHRSHEEFRKGIVGIYALAMMEREGPIHGYLISERIAARTEGAWRPGAGAVYPALNKLVENGLAKRRQSGRRMVYEITRAGRAFLAKVRNHDGLHPHGRLDLSPLMADVMGAEAVEDFVFMRLRRTLERLESYLDRAPQEAHERLRKQVLAEIAQAEDRIRGGKARKGGRK